VLDIRATSYVSPVSEVTFESVPLTVHLANVADETGLVTGKFRVYNDTTGLLIHTSDIAPLTLAAGQSVDVTALTDFEPPAPADDTYFVIFDGHASNALVPDGINFVLGKFDFDVKPTGMGPAPATHHLTHEEGGGDEIPVEDMGTAELDDTLVLQPDGAGGVEWEAIPAGVTDHDLLNNLDYASAGHTGFAPTAHDHAGDDLKFVKVHPAADSNAALQILKADDATVVLRIDTTNARVGIGTGAPAYPLDVDGNARIGPAASNQGYLYFGGTTQNIYVDVGNWYFTGATGHDLAFMLNPGSASTIKNLQGNLHIDASVASSYLTLQTQSTIRVYVDDAGLVGIGTTAPAISDGIGLHITGKILRLGTDKTPASAGAAGNKGEICWDADYIYVCTATNTWKRAAIATW